MNGLDIVDNGKFEVFLREEYFVADEAMHALDWFNIDILLDEEEDNMGQNLEGIGGRLRFRRISAH